MLLFDRKRSKQRNFVVSINDKLVDWPKEEKEIVTSLPGCQNISTRTSCVTPCVLERFLTFLRLCSGKRGNGKTNKR